MAQKETIRQTEQFTYYTPTHLHLIEGVGGKTPTPEREAKLLRRFVQKCTYPFLEAEEERKIKLFTNGTAPHYPTESSDSRSRFVSEAEQVVSQYCREYFDSSGTVLPNRQQDWNNLCEIAPKLVAIVADRKNYISMVHQSDALNIIGAAIVKVQKPDTPLVIRTGIGGSDDPFTSARFPAYGLPAFHIAEQI